MHQLLRLVAICVLPAAASPLPSATRLLKRQATSTVASSLTAPEATPTDRSEWRGQFRGNQTDEEGSPLLSAVTIALLCSVFAILIMARLYYVLKNYPFSLRAFFVPPGGVDLFGIKIKAATPRPPKGPPPRYTPGHHFVRTRRGVRVEGEDVGEGGARVGERDEDDAFDNEERGVAPKESLPTYAVDYTLPGYHPGQGSPRITADSSRRTEEVLPSTREYEAATRRAPPSRTDSSQPTTQVETTQVEMQQIIPEPLRRHTSTDTASSSATRVEDFEGSSKAENKPEEERIEDAGITGDLGEMEMTTRTSEPVSVRRE